MLDKAPVGYDMHGYGLRDKTGESVHQGKRRTYGSPFTPGDVIGALITLPADNRTEIPRADERDYFDSEADGNDPKDAETLAKLQKRLRVLPGSEVVFYRNGVCMGPAFRDIYAGTHCLYLCAIGYCVWTEEAV